jgi:hypothetical protein
MPYAVSEQKAALRVTISGASPTIVTNGARQELRLPLIDQFELDIDHVSATANRGAWAADPSFLFAEATVGSQKVLLVTWLTASETPGANCWFDLAVFRDGGNGQVFDGAR